jgi:hypothetical protein
MTSWKTISSFNRRVNGQSFNLLLNLCKFTFRPTNDRETISNVTQVQLMLFSSDLCKEKQFQGKKKPKQENSDTVAQQAL